MFARRVFAFPAALAALLAIAAPAFALSSRELASPRGTQPGEFMGQAVAALDFNGDGIADLAAGSNFNSGRVRVFLGPNYETAALTVDGPASERFGFSLASSDFNGDGFQDLIAGATGDMIAVIPGRAYVYFGGPFPDLDWDLVLTAGANLDGFGWSVAGADLNRDGYGDFVVGAPLDDVNGADAGRVYVYFGGAVPDNLSDYNTAFFADAGESCGWSMASAGDHNGDGYADVAVGMMAENFPFNDAGAAHVLLGNPVGAGFFGWRTYRGTAADQLFGWAVGGAGDMNGDGFDDLIVGAKGDDVPVNNVGAAYVFFGGPTADLLPDWEYHGNALGQGWGSCVGGAGDVNADGYDDAMMNGGNGVAIFLGGSTLPNAPSIWLSLGPNSSGATSLAAAGDVDGDGNDDVLIGDGWESASTSSLYQGRAWLFAVFPYQLLAPNGGEIWMSGGSATVRWRGHDVADLHLSTDGGLSWNLLASGMGGDEENEFTLSVPDLPAERCRIRVCPAGATPTRGNSDASADDFRIVRAWTPPPVANHVRRTFTGAAANDQLGSAGCGADFNGDGAADVAIGVPGSDVAGVNAGQVLVYWGGAAGDAIADVVLNGAAAGDNFGFHLRPAGDVNRDGYVDLIVGANTNDFAGVDAGRAYVYFGGPAMDATPDWTLTGEAAGDGFGFIVAGPGDVNRDGYADVLVTAPFNDFSGANAGRAYIFLGGGAPDATPDLTLYGEAAGDNFGYMASEAGDVNADGYPDWMVGAFNNDTGGSNAGRAYVFFGGALPDRFPDLAPTGTLAGDRMGAGLAAPGDWDGDGHDDFVVGAYQAGGGVGRSYLFRGGPQVDAVADYTFAGGNAGEFYGYVANGAGDVNGDGYGDFVVAGFHGRAYVYCGGPAPDVVADHVITGASGDAFAFQLGSAGDVDGDGFDDLCIGALGNDAAASNAGRAYLYDFNRYVVTTPNGGETWNVGAMMPVTWLGAEPADLWLSVDGGASWQILATSVGGAAVNSVPVRVPHQPTKFARVKLTPADPALRGSDASDSLFTIQTSVALLALSATLEPAGGVAVTWSSEPGVGPEGLAGYRLYRNARGDRGAGTRVGPELIAETRYVDAQGGAGASYRLVAVNGLMQELELGRVELPVAVAGLRAWPVPWRGGDLHVEFAAPMAAPGFAATDLDVGLFDLAGRRVATLARGPQASAGGVVSLKWKPAEAGGLGAGVYFLRATAPSAAWSEQRRCVLVP